MAMALQAYIVFVVYVYSSVCYCISHLCAQVMRLSYNGALALVTGLLHFDTVMREERGLGQDA